MRWFRTHELFLGIFLTVAVFALGFVIASSMPPPSQQIEKTDHPQAANEGAERTAEKQIAYYTKWLAWFTGALVAVSAFQGYFLLRSDKTARIAANAADLSARAAISLQLPIIRVEPDKLGHGEFASGQEIIEDCYVHSVSVSNLGATKAFPKEVLFGWTAGETLPEEPSYQCVARFPHNCILKPDQINFIQPLVGGLILKEGQWTRICGGNYLWFYCAILYEDFMGETRTHGFCWRWSSTGMGVDWRVEKAAAYNKKNAALSEPPQYP
jgi:hypothetical protein